MEIKSPQRYQILNCIFPFGSVFTKKVVYCILLLADKTFNPTVAFTFNAYNFFCSMGQMRNVVTLHYLYYNHDKVVCPLRENVLLQHYASREPNLKTTASRFSYLYM